MTKDKPLFFTNHQLKRMAKRGISKVVIQTIVDNGAWERGKNPFSYEVEYKGIIVILYGQRCQYNVSTCKLNREYTCMAEKVKDELNIDFWKATHKIVKEIVSKEFKNLI